MSRGRREGEAVLERSLVARVRGGDTEAFGELFALYRAPIFKLCLQRLGNAALAEDAVQETFLRAFRSFASFDDDRSFFSWLAAIASNRTIDLAKEEGRHRSEEISVTYTAATGSDEMTIVDRIRLVRALSDLPDRSRAAFLMHDLAGWSFAEIAAALGGSEVAARAAAFRTRAALKAMLRVVLVPAFAIRRWFRRASMRRYDLASADSVVQAAPALLFSSAMSIVMLVSAVGSSVIAPRLRPPAASSVLGRAAVAAGDRAGTPSVNRGSTDSPPERSEPVRWTVATKPHRKGAAAPQHGYIRFDVYAPDGTHLYYSETEYTCYDPIMSLEDELPKDAPVRSGC